MQYDKKINKRKLEDIHLNDEVLVHKPVTKRTKGGSLKPTFTGLFKTAAVNQNSFKVNINSKLHSYNRGNLKKGMYYFFFFRYSNIKKKIVYTRNLIDH